MSFTERSILRTVSAMGAADHAEQRLSDTSPWLTLAGFGPAGVKAEPGSIDDAVYQLDAAQPDDDSGNTTNATTPLWRPRASK